MATVVVRESSVVLLLESAPLAGKFLNDCAARRIVWDKRNAGKAETFTSVSIRTIPIAQRHQAHSLPWQRFWFTWSELDDPSAKGP